MKKLGMAAVAGVMTLTLFGCGAKDFDATGYVQGVLDATYHGEYAAHAEDVGESEDAIREEMEANTLAIAEQALASSGMTATQEELQEYVDLIEEGYQKVEYTVGEAVEEDGNYTVEVTVTPVGLLDNLETIFTEKLQAAVNNGIDESGYMAVFNESVKESIASAKTYDPQTVTLHVTYTEEGNNRIYTVEEADLTTLDAVATNQQ